MSSTGVQTDSPYVSRIDRVYHGEESGYDAEYKIPTERGIMRWVPYDVEGTGLSTTNIIKWAIDRGYSRIR
jgi:hypothetical protein